MKTQFQLLTAAVLSATIFSCTEETPAPINQTPAPKEISVSLSGEINLTEGQSQTLQIDLSSPATRGGTVQLRLSPQVASALSTSPAHNNGLLTLEIAKGWTAAHISIWAIDNYTVSESQIAGFLDLETVSSGFKLGNIQSVSVVVADNDEPIQPYPGERKLKSWTTPFNGVDNGQTFTYDEEGRVTSVKWVSNASSGTYTYFYDEEGDIERVNQFEGKDVYYHKENGRIVKSETIQFGVLKSYTLYDYDFTGKISATAEYNRQENGEYVNSFITLYLYHIAGDLYKKIVYVPGDEEGELIEISYDTYENYTSSKALVPIHYIIPGIATNEYLPATFSHNRDGKSYEYSFDYEFDSFGNLVKRTASSIYGSETTFYQYY